MTRQASTVSAHGSRDSDTVRIFAVRGDESLCGRAGGACRAARVADRARPRPRPAAALAGHGRRRRRRGRASRRRGRRPLPAADRGGRAGVRRRKPQLACFERLGAPGLAALHEVVAVARAAGLLVIADGKRGDVPVTAAAYAQALAGSDADASPARSRGSAADAFTANPLLGVDALEPLIATGAGVFVLVRTSNPGAADVQDRRARRRASALWERLARIVDELGRGARLRPQRRRRGDRRDRARAPRAGARADAARAVSCCRGSARRAAASRSSRRRSRPGAPAAWSAPRARSSSAHASDAAGDRRRRREPRPSGCAQLAWRSAERRPTRQ